MFLSDYFKVYRPFGQKHLILQNVNTVSLSVQGCYYIGMKYISFRKNKNKPLVSSQTTNILSV